MQYFKPSDIRTVPCTVQNITAKGAAFAIDEEEESVYIPPNLMQRMNLDIGDALTCYCIDQSLDENRRHEVTARYRAIRLKVEQRLADILPGFAASDAMANSAELAKSEPEKPREVTLDEARSIIGECFKRRRAWTPHQLLSEVADADKAAVVTQEMRERITGWLVRLHRDGILAACEIRTKADGDPRLYYAATEDIFIQLVDDYELDDE